jgi:tRNA1(Val) A37 N6-methylase TrmN6
MSFAGSELTDDALTGAFRVWQRRRGHRYSLDDVATAWEAARAMPSAARACDLGCGIGSVLLMVAYKLPSARLTGIEAQPVSLDLARRNVERNGVADRVELLLGDLRDLAIQARAGVGEFDLVSGTPPYKPPREGTHPPDAQRAYARIELRGGVEDYLRAAARLVAPRGRVVVCSAADRVDRALAGAAAAELAPVRRRDVIPRAGTKSALFTVWTLARRSDHDVALVHEPDLVARDAMGRRTEAAHALRRFFDLPPSEVEVVGA